MRFDSLSEAILYYTSAKNPLSGIAPYGDLAGQTAQPPQNLNNFKPNPPSGLVYGQSIWGIGAVINVSKPQL
jgi:hypothetical protein